MAYVTLYKRRGKVAAYRTVNDSPMHANLRANHGGTTRRDAPGKKPLAVITDFIPGMPLMQPLLVGGEAVLP